MIRKQKFGRTGHESTRVIFGAAALGSVDQVDADRTLNILLEYGINHFDVAASYGNGEAEKRMGPWMAEQRDKIFLATKTNFRTHREAKEQFESSLERLRVDSVDLIQMHNLIEPDEWDIAMGPGGALEYLVEAREQGLTRFIGVTGHGLTAPVMHRRSLDRYPFDSVLLPYNYMLHQNPDFVSGFESLLERCRESSTALQIIKSVARQPWEGEKRRTTWYEPLEDQEDIDLAASWILGIPDVFLITAGDTNVAPRILAAADKNLPRPTDAEMTAMMERRSMKLIFEGSKTRN